MKTYLIKLSEHLNYIKDFIEGDFKLVGKNNRNTIISSVPNYYLTLNKRYNDGFISYFFQKQIGEIDGYGWWCGNSGECDLEYIIKEIEDIVKEEGKEILMIEEIHINEIQN